MGSLGFEGLYDHNANYSAEGRPKSGGAAGGDHTEVRARSSSDFGVLNEPGWAD